MPSYAEIYRNRGIQFTWKCFIDTTAFHNYAVASASSQFIIYAAKDTSYPKPYARNDAQSVRLET